MTKNFFSSKRAEAFAAQLAKQGIKAEITAAQDAFNQTLYRVEWSI